jgi:hypothetical protein
VFRFDANNTDASPLSCKISPSPNLQAQRCELTIIANHLILKVFLPYLKNCTAPSSDGLPRRVVSSVVDAGHAVLQAMRVLHSTWRQTQPAAFLFYPFGRTLFDTAVMMACAVIAHPSSASSSVAIADVTAAIDIIQDTRIGSGRSKLDDRKDLPEAEKIITLLKTKAEAKLAGDDPAANPVSAIGSKRRHDDVPDASSFADSFELPYVGAGVKASHPSSEPSVETALKVPTSLPKPRAKQRSGSTVQDPCRASEGPPLAERDVGQIPVRGRPRTDSNVHHRHSSTKKHTTPTTVSTHSQSSTPTPDQTGFHPMPELTRPESRPHACAPDYDATIYTPTSSVYEPAMHASPSYASLSASGSSSQSSPAYSQGPIPSPHPYGQPGQEFYGLQAPTTPSYDSPMASLGMNVGESQSQHSSVPPEEPTYLMDTAVDVRRLSFPSQQNGAIGLQNLPPPFAPVSHGMLPASSWQPDVGLPSRPSVGETWQDFKYP